jgi:hypothetical protein
MNQERVTQRQHVRTAVVPELLELLDGEFERHPEAKDIVWTAMALWLQRRRDASAIPSLATATAEPMSDVQARAFGKSFMPWGEYKGQAIDQVPLERLAYYADHDHGFVRQIRRYLASRRVRAEEGSGE